MPNSDHLYEECGDPDCPRFGCVAFKKGYQEGFQDGSASGYAAGYAQGVADGAQAQADAGV